MNRLVKASRSALLASLTTGLLLALSTAGCSDAETEKAPSDSTSSTLSAGPFHVEAGGEIVMCTYVRSENEAAEDVRVFNAHQSPGGHHLIVYTVDHAIDLPPSACPQGGQPSWNQILATQLHDEEQAFPEGIGFKIAPHQQFVLETHFINTTGAALDVDSSLAMTFAEPGTVKERAGTYFFGTFNIDVPPNSTWSKSVECAPPQDMNILSMFGHEHRKGTGVSVEMLQGGSGPAASIYATKEWEAPPVKVFEGGMALTMNDTIRVTCDWDNDGDEALRYPHEMCFAIGYYWPADGSYVCGSGGGTDDCACRKQGVTDAGPGGARVDVSLTRKETISGAIGELDAGAPIYCALFREEDWAGFFPKEGAQPQYFRDAVDVPLATASDEATFVFDDVSPGDYVVTCLMDTIGGGFIVGSGDVVNSSAGHVSAEKGAPAQASVVLDYAIP